MRRWTLLPNLPSTTSKCFYCLPRTVYALLPPTTHSVLFMLTHTFFSASLLSYCSEYDSSYSFGSPTDDWPSMSVDEEATKAVRAHMRRGPLNTIRRVAGRFKDIIVQ